MRIAVLALQGAFIEHEQMLQKLGAETFEVRKLRDWEQPKDALVLPGGESTVQMRLLKELGLFEPIRKAIAPAKNLNSRSTTFTAPPAIVTLYISLFLSIVVQK